MFFNLPSDWESMLQQEFTRSYFKVLSESVTTAYIKQKVYPPAQQVFRALELCPFNSVKVVIIGQDPYHASGQAHGLSFSVQEEIRQPPSLRNIFKELKEDIEDFEIPASGNLESWAKQGVLMLNTILTVQESMPGSHKQFGWELFTDAIIKLICEKKENVVFLLWGNYAISKSPLIDSSKHLVLTAAHPSPLARGAFFGSKHFSKTNKYLVEKGLSPVDWRLQSDKS